MKFIDDFLNGITMYRLVLYVLVSLLLVATVLSFLRVLPFGPVSLLALAAFLIAVSWLTNTIFAYVFKTPTNLESVYITSLILTLIITPTIHSLFDVVNFAWVAILAETSKYIFAVSKKHIFNPAAFSVFLTAIFLNKSASWWVGTFWMTPFVVVGGLLMVRKIRKFSLVFAFLVVSLIVVSISSFLKGSNIFSVVQRTILETQILFFVFVMLTEPLTTPPKRSLQIIYGGLTGLLYVPFIHFGSFYLTPEMALLIGNIFSFAVSPGGKVIMRLKEKIQLTPDTYDFVFDPSKQLKFLPGQYLEWTLGQPDPDSRGSRRSFTIASSPTEGNLRFGIKFYPGSSSFKKLLFSLNPGAEVAASQLAGEFTLPQDPNKKLIFVAGGIGITPYRSILKFLTDTNQKRDIILLYSSNLITDFVYRDVFEAALQKLGIRTVYILTDLAKVPQGWTGKTGFIDAKIIQAEVPDYKDRTFYISGPHSMVNAVKNALKGMSIPGKQIKVDFFSGYA